MRVFTISTFLSLFIVCSWTQKSEDLNLNVYKICATEKYASQCSQMQRGNSEVVCQRVQDSLECAQRLLNETADFGLFSAESTLHLATLGWAGMTVIKRLVHKDRPTAPADFESVVVVKASHTGGIDGLKGKKFCHPGLRYEKSSRWSEQIYKHFERSIFSTYNCNPGQSPAETETAMAASYFGKSCRPGIWSHDIKEDAELKKKYPSLCELCDSPSSCDYVKGFQDQQGALNCLKQSGDVAYVSRSDVEKFFEKNDKADYRYLCPNGTLEEILNSNNPCVWLRQPWGVIIATREKAEDIKTKISEWTSSGVKGKWETALKEILEADSNIPSPVNLQFPIDYIKPFRQIPYFETSVCQSQITWCTTSSDELEKCKIIRAAGMSAGVYPYINCREPLRDTIECFKDIKEKSSDFMGIDSNFGFIARKVFNLTAAMYFETEMEQYSSVVVVTHAGSKYKSFESLRGAKACVPEFGATPTIAFINLGKERKFFNRNECRYSKLLRDFFGPTCAPGANDIRRDFNNQTDQSESESLCELCLNNDIRSIANLAINIDNFNSETAVTFPNKVTCTAEEDNRYHGNKGALRCLHESGDVAIVELQSLADHATFLGLDENKFQIMCRNGTLAQPGLKADTDCALTTIVDGEIVTRRNTSKMSWIINALASFDLYFEIDPDLKMYNIYNSKKHLLFKDSTIGLTSINEKAVSPSVENYIKLFKNTEDCVQGNAGTRVAISLTSTVVLVLTALFMSH